MYLPTNPSFKIKSININSGAPMQSAAKCPYMVSFSGFQDNVHLQEY